MLSVREIKATAIIELGNDYGARSSIGYSTADLPASEDLGLANAVVELWHDPRFRSIVGL